MPKPISELTQVPFLTGSELIEVSVPDVDSDTGYSTFSTTADKLLGGIPFRKTLSGTFPTTPYEITIPYNDIVANSLFPDEDDSGLLAMAILHINLLLSFVPDSSDEYPYVAPLVTTVLINRIGRSMNNGMDDENDGHRIRTSTFQPDNDDLVALPLVYGMSYTNSFKFTPIITVEDVRQEMPYGDIKIGVKLSSPTDRSFPSTSNVKYKGYIDVVASFAEFVPFDE